MTQALGLVAGACTASAAAPQVWKAYKTKAVQGVSKKMFLFYVVGMALWLTYGILRSDIPIIVTNAISLTLNGIMLFLKYKYHQEPVTGQSPELA